MSNPKRGHALNCCKQILSEMVKSVIQPESKYQGNKKDATKKPLVIKRDPEPHQR